MKSVNLADIEKVPMFYVTGPLRANPRILFHSQLFMLYNISSYMVAQKSQIGTMLACFSAQRRVSRPNQIYQSYQSTAVLSTHWMFMFIVKANNKCIISILQRRFSYD